MSYKENLREPLVKNNGFQSFYLKGIMTGIYQNINWCFVLYSEIREH